MKDTSTLDMLDPASYGKPISAQFGANRICIQVGDSIVPSARRSDPHTSHAAAEGMEQGAHQHRTVILTCLRLYKEQTIYEIAKRVGLTHVQVARRTAELHKAKKIQRVIIGHDVKDIYWTRLSPTGRPCCVWQIVL